MPLITCPTLYYLFFWLKTKRSRGFENRILPSYLKEKQNSCCSVAENNETLQMRRRLIKTKHSIFGQGNSKRGHIHSIHPFLVFAIHAPLLPFVFVSLSLSVYFSLFVWLVVFYLFCLVDPLTLQLYRCTVHAAFHFLLVLLGCCGSGSSWVRSGKKKKKCASPAPTPNRWTFDMWVKIQNKSNTAK